MSITHDQRKFRVKHLLTDLKEYFKEEYIALGGPDALEHYMKVEPYYTEAPSFFLLLCKANFNLVDQCLCDHRETHTVDQANATPLKTIYINGA